MAGESPIAYDLRWPVVSLAEIAVKIGSGATPKGGADAYLPSRARFALVRSQNVFDRRFGYNGLAFISDEQADGLRGVILKPNDILLNITGDGITFGRACMVPKDVLPACVNQHVSIIRLDPQRADAGYVLAFLTHPEVKLYIESFNAGGSRRAVTKGHIESFWLPLPPLQEQRAIAQILSMLDDKIELNRRMNETLEAMARALFKSWFIDFDPVRRNAARTRNQPSPWPTSHPSPNGRGDRDEGMVAGEAYDHLFPDSFEDSKLGEIPRGWEVKGFADTIEIVGGGTPRTSVAEYWDGDIPWFSVVDAPTHSEVWAVDTEKKVTRAGVENSSTRVLPVGTTIISARGTVGRIALVGVPMAMNQSCYGLRGRAGAHGFFNYFSTRELVARLQQHAHGSVFDTITRDTLAGVSVVAPAAELIEEFEKRVAPILQRIRAGLLEARTLAALRDTLLPKLISGELRVKDLEVGWRQMPDRHRIS